MASSLSAALEHYRRMLATCHEHKLTPIVTLHHFTSPRWIAARGGWESHATAERFARYCGRVARHLGDMIGFACTINELNSTPMLQHMKILPPDDAMRNLAWRREAAHAMGVEPEKLQACFPFAQPAKLRSSPLRHIAWAPRRSSPEPPIFPSA